MTWGDVFANVSRVPESATPTGTGDPSLWGHLRVVSTENGPVHEASAEPVHGTNATNRYVGWSAGSPVEQSG